MQSDFRQRKYFKKFIYRTERFEELNNMTMTSFIRSHYKGNLIACGGYTFEKAHKDISNDEFDLVAIGKPFIANFDLITRARNNIKLNTYHIDMLNNLY